MCCVQVLPYLQQEKLDQIIPKIKPRWGKVMSHTQMVPHIGSAQQGPSPHQVTFKSVGSWDPRKGISMPLSWIPTCFPEQVSKEDLMLNDSIK